MKLLIKTSELSARIIEVISVVLLVLMIATTCYQVFLRYLFNSPTSWSAEVAVIFLIWFGYLGIALGIKEKGHISIDFIYNKLSPVHKKCLDLFFYICMIIFSVMMIGNGKLLFSVTTMQKMPATGLSKALLYLTLIVTGVLMILYSVQNILEVFFPLRDMKKKKGGE
jgi:TRAP-type transport system small permease protein